MVIAKLLPRDLRDCLKDRHHNIAISKGGFSLRCFIYNYPLQAISIIYLTATCTILAVFMAFDQSWSLGKQIAIATVIGFCITALAVSVGLEFQYSSRNPRVVYRRTYAIALLVGAKLGWSERRIRRELLTRNHHHWWRLHNHSTNYQIMEAITKTFTSK